MFTKMDKRLKYGLVLGVILALVVATVALADTVQGDDVLSGGNANKTPGENGTASFYLVDSGSDGCNVDSSTTATGTVVSNQPWLTIDSPGYVTFDACKTGSILNNETIGYTVLPSAPIGGVAEIKISAMSGGISGNNGWQLNPSAFNVTVIAPSDTTSPVITPVVIGTLGNNGWYTSDVTVTWDVSDPDSTITSTSGCDLTTIDYDTAGITLTCSATSAGGTSSESVTIKRYATAPTISSSASPAPNAAGWNNTNVAVSFTCDDNLSGVASCGPDDTLTGEGADQSVTGTAVDNAGNSDSATVSGINIDKTPPVVNVTGVTDGATYTLGSVPEADCSTTDALSGVATEATLSVSGGPVGSVTASCDGALDKAGNSGSASVTYSVIYDFDGFFQPVDMSKLNVAKAGSAIPVKFSLSGDQGLDIFATGYPKAVVIACDTSVLTDVVESTVTAGGSSLSYDALADQYIYVWKTSKDWTNSCRQLQVMLDDGTTHVANFQFKK
jgi:hypothetical protein